MDTMPNKPPFSGIEACVFDAYGTIFDVRSAVMKCRDSLGQQTETLAKLWRRKQLEYSWLRSVMGSYTDFWRITGDSLDHAMQALGLKDMNLRARLMNLYMRLDAYSDVHEALRQINDAGVKTAILSNGSPYMLIAAAKNADLYTSFKRILSVDELQVYKPHPSVYQLAVEELDVPSQGICFLSSNAWDVAGASRFGFQSIWVNRNKETADLLPGLPAAEIDDLSRLPEVIDIEWAHEQAQQ